MELLFYIFILVLVIFLGIGPFLPSLMTVSAEDISENLNSLKKYSWFQDLLKNERYKQLIVHDNDVRKLIGRFNNKKLNKGYFQNKYRRKLQCILQQKLNYDT